jgi:hypothetical protein
VADEMQARDAVVLVEFLGLGRELDACFSIEPRRLGYLQLTAR